MRVAGEGGRRGWQARVAGEGGRRGWQVRVVCMSMTIVNKHFVCKVFIHQLQLVDNHKAISI